MELRDVTWVNISACSFLNFLALFTFGNNESGQLGDTLNRISLEHDRLSTYILNVGMTVDPLQKRERLGSPCFCDSQAMNHHWEMP